MLCHFGSLTWFFSITVAEMHDPSSDESLAASSVIMPEIAPQATAPSGLERQFSISSMTVLSALSSESASSVSLLDVPSSNSSDDDDDDAAYEDSRSQVITSPVEHAQDVEYVMLFESSSESD